jgi:hypothetical protein
MSLRKAFFNQFRPVRRTIITSLIVSITIVLLVVPGVWTGSSYSEV